ncbi:hypothetical protein NFI96_007096 [Prochilodus magdalenae]|nr:hypothetical protein NFI96_007096 [Prochilodus magdalenae]
MFRMTPETGSCAGEPVCASLSLTSATWAALSDGAGNLTLLRTSKRGESSHLKWEPMFSKHLGEPFTILHSLSHVQEGVHTIELLLLRIQKDPADAKGSGFCTSLEWITVDNSAGIRDTHFPLLVLQSCSMGRAFPSLFFAVPYIDQVLITCALLTDSGGHALRGIWLGKLVDLLELQ